MTAKGLVHVRIDDRMIHGQVAVYWCHAVEATRLMVANDAMASDETLKAALRLVVPPGLRSSLLDVQTAATNLTAGKYAGQRVMLVVRRPHDVLRLMDLGVDLEAVNVGNLPAREHTTTLRKSICVTPAEVAELCELNRRGVRLTGRQVPDNPDDDLMTLLEPLRGGTRDLYL